MPVDLTVFNGPTAPGSDPQVGELPTHFEARQRGTQNDPYSANDLWKQEPVVKAAWTDVPSRIQMDHIFQNGLKHSLGYLNQPFGQPQASPPAPVPGDPSGYWTPPPFPATPPPLPPFPWFTANSRPVRQPAGTVVGAGVQFIEIVGLRWRLPLDLAT